MISISQLNLTFNNKTILDNIDLNIREGEVFGIAGPGGAGKTAFLKILATVLKPSGGRVLISGFDIAKDRDLIRPTIGYVPDSAASDPGSSVNEYLCFFLSIYGKKNDSHLESLGRILNELDLTHRTNTPLSELSDEEKKRVSLARAIVHDPALLLLDDPGPGTDTEWHERLASVIKGQAGMGKTAVAASDSISFLNTIADRIGLFHRGRLLWISRSGVESSGSIEKRINELIKGEDESCNS